MHERELLSFVETNWLAQNSEVTLQEGSHLVFRRQDSSIYLLEYFIHRNTLVVIGDVGDAIYRWSQPITFEWLARLDVQYFAEKCVASERGFRFMEWDTQLARARIDAFIAGLEEDRNPHKLSSADRRMLYAASGSSHELWRTFEHELSDDARRLIGSFDCLAEIGQRVAARCAAHLQGIKMAMKQAGARTPAESPQLTADSSPTQGGAA